MGEEKIMSDKEELKAFIMGVIDTEGDSEPAQEIVQKLADIIERKSHKYVDDTAMNFQLDTHE